MPQVTLFDSGTVVTGSGGFIGTRLTDILGRNTNHFSSPADVCSADALEKLGRGRETRAVVHLAASGTVLTDFSRGPRMLDVSVDGAVNAIQAFRPQRVVYTSSCAIYGDALPAGGAPGWDEVHPIGIYGLSKAITEKTLDQWARKTGATTVVLRLGNVIGSGCAGLIAYLVRHAIKYPDGGVPARMRGGGAIHRDYVPVDYVVRMIELALETPVDPGCTAIYNSGSGRTMSNRDVAGIVQEWLATEGYVLNVEFEPHLGDGESRFSGLQTASAELAFGLTPPTPEDVRQAIVDGARYILGSGTPLPSPVQTS